jgi:hypothetical protein
VRTMRRPTLLATVAAAALLAAAAGPAAASSKVTRIAYGPGAISPSSAFVKKADGSRVTVVARGRPVKAPWAVVIWRVRWSGGEKQLPARVGFACPAGHLIVGISVLGPKGTLALSGGPAVAGGLPRAVYALVSPRHLKAGDVRIGALCWRVPATR